MKQEDDKNVFEGNVNGNKQGPRQQWQECHRLSCQFYYWVQLLNSTASYHGKIKHDERSARQIPSLLMDDQKQRHGQVSRKFQQFYPKQRDWFLDRIVKRGCIYLIRKQITPPKNARFSCPKEGEKLPNVRQSNVHHFRRPLWNNFATRNADLTDCEFYVLWEGKFNWFVSNK